MHFDGHVKVRAPQPRVFEMMSDPKQMAACIPDLQRVNVKSADEFEAVVKVGVSFIRGDFALWFRTIERKAPTRLKLKVHGTGLGSAVDMELAADLSSSAAGGASMRWTAEANVSGKIASLGQRLMESQAERIIKQFFDCFRQKLDAP